MRYAYYPGCSLHSSAREYDASLRAVSPRLGIELTYVKDWVCCGAPATHIGSRRLAGALALHNLAQVEKQGFREVLVPCAACFSRFKFAQHDMDESPQVRQEMEGILGHRFVTKVKVLHPLEVFTEDSMLDEMTASVTQKLSALEVVCYYGCLLTRPPKVTGFKDAEYPQSMDRLLRALGATVLDWSYRTDCCGASFALTRTDIVLKLSHDILEGARQAGAQAISVACPLCQLNLDSRQREIEAEYGTKYGLPIYYFTQLMGVALGIPEKELKLNAHFVDALKPLEKVGML